MVENSVILKGLVGFLKATASSAVGDRFVFDSAGKEFVGKADLLLLLLSLLSGSDKVLFEGADSVSIDSQIHGQRFDFAHIGRLIEVLGQCLLSLDSSVSDLADLLGVEGLPRLTVHVFKEGNDVDGVDKVDKGITNVASVVHIHGQVEEVILSFMEPIDSLEKHILGVLVRDIADHDGGAGVLSSKDLLKVDGELRVLASRGTAVRASSRHVAGDESARIIVQEASELLLHLTHELVAHWCEASLMFNLKVWLVEGLRLLEWVLREGDSRIVGIEVDKRALREELE